VKLKSLVSYSKTIFDPPGPKLSCVRCQMLFVSFLHTVNMYILLRCDGGRNFWKKKLTKLLGFRVVTTPRLPEASSRCSAWPSHPSTRCGASWLMQNLQGNSEWAESIPSLSNLMIRYFRVSQIDQTAHTICVKMMCKKGPSVKEHQYSGSHANPIHFTRNHRRWLSGSSQVYMSTLHAKFSVWSSS
jgi:hypothetical protein